jgi:hypothetical protein
LKIKGEVPGLGNIDEEIKYGDMRLLPMPVGVKAKFKIEPARGFDIGAGKGDDREIDLEGGVVGLVFDCRGRPFRMPEDENKRVESITRWLTNLEVYPNV